ncbi:hypothetical protein FDECE_7144 [Fusarium decemcellulare]|nr:hypothetical protein FDECE_7144 [Fusarium decemcellulare]
MALVKPSLVFGRWPPIMGVGGIGPIMPCVIPAGPTPRVRAEEVERIGPVEASWFPTCGILENVLMTMLQPQLVHLVRSAPVASHCHASIDIYSKPHIDGSRTNPPI